MTEQNESRADEERGAQGAEAGVAIVGFGAAGLNAAVALRAAGYRGRVRVFSDAGALPYSPILTSYYAGGEKERAECFPWSEEEVAELDVELVLEGPVTGLDPRAHVVRTREGAHGYAKCIIATGASPVAAGFPADCGYEPLVLRSMDDADRLRDALVRPGCERVLVSGASMVALKMAEACLERGAQVTIVGMNEGLLDMSALPPAAERFERGLAAQGVEVRLCQTIASVDVVPDEERPRGRRLEVAFSMGDVDSFDEVCVAHGMRCNLGFLEEGALELDRGLLVDEFMRTSDPDVYAAGDVAQAAELVSGERRIVGIWKNAAVQGACAGRAVAAELAGGRPDAAKAFAGAIPTNTVAVRGTLFISAGSVELNPDRRFEVHETDDMTVVCVYERIAEGGERLVGFNVASDRDEEGGLAYDVGALLTLRIEQGVRG